MSSYLKHVELSQKRRYISFEPEGYLTERDFELLKNI